MKEHEILKTLDKKHISDLQSEVYKHNKRHVINASDVINSLELIYLMGFKIVKDDNR